MKGKTMERKTKANHMQKNATNFTSAFTPRNAQSLHQHVVEQIVQQIVGGALPPHALLPPEPDLAQQFGVSRTVIREAIRVLVSKGLVTVKQGSGMRVQPPEKWNHLDPMVLFEQVRSGRSSDLLEELLEVRRILEVEVAALAAERRTDEDRVRLGANLAGMAKLINDPEAYTRLDIDFHEQILNAARNRLLREALGLVAEALYAGRFITTHLSGGTERAQHGHEAIYAAIERGDAEAARAAMRDHVLQFERDM